jgi:hypothetical protein
MDPRLRGGDERAHDKSRIFSETDNYCGNRVLNVIAL